VMVVIKMNNNQYDTEVIKANADRFKNLQHRGFIKIYCYFFHVISLFVIQDPVYWEGGSLKFFVRNLYTEGLPEDVIAGILKGSLVALGYLHKKGQPLCDFRARNLILNRDGTIAINPISLRTITNSKTRESLPFIAPELLGSTIEESLKLKGDIWSFGITAIHLATGQIPYDNLGTPAQITTAIREQPRPTLKGNFSSVFLDAINICLEKDPNKRPSVDDLLKHKFFVNAGDDKFLTSFLNNLPPSVDWSLHDGDLLDEFDQKLDFSTLKGNIMPPKVDLDDTQEELPNETVPKIVISQEIPNPILFNAPIQSYVGEKDNDYYVYIRTIPSTKIQLTVTSKSLIIEGSFPHLPIENEVKLNQPIVSNFSKLIEFEEEIDYNSLNRTLVKETSTLVIRIKKFSQITISSEIIF